MVHNPGGDWHPGWGVDLTYRWEILGVISYPTKNSLILLMEDFLEVENRSFGD